MEVLDRAEAERRNAQVLGRAEQKPTDLNCLKNLRLAALSSFFKKYLKTETQLRNLHKAIQLIRDENKFYTQVF